MNNKVQNISVTDYIQHLEEDSFQDNVQLAIKYAQEHIEELDNNNIKPLEDELLEELYDSAIDVYLILKEIGLEDFITSDLRDKANNFMKVYNEVFNILDTPFLDYGYTVETRNGHFYVLSSHREKYRFLPASFAVAIYGDGKVTLHTQPQMTDIKTMSKLAKAADLTQEEYQLIKDHYFLDLTLPEDASVLKQYAPIVQKIAPVLA